MGQAMHTPSLSPQHLLQLLVSHAPCCQTDIILFVNVYSQLPPGGAMSSSGGAAAPRSALLEASMAASMLASSTADSMAANGLASSWAGLQPHSI